MTQQSHMLQPYYKQKMTQQTLAENGSFLPLFSSSGALVIQVWMELLKQASLMYQQWQ